MSRAESLLNELMNAWLHGAEEDVPEVVSEIEEYLNRKEDLVVGSEWVCESSCLLISTNKTDAILGTAGNTVILEDWGGTFCQIRLKDTSCLLPIQQFLACFSPKI